MLEYKCQECGESDTKNETLSFKEDKFEKEYRFHVQCAHCAVEREIKVTMKKSKLMLDII